MNVFDLAGSVGRGQQVGVQQAQIRRQNALADLYRQQGPGIMSGDQNALNALAQFDPQAALGMRNSLNAETRAQESHGMGLRVDTARLAQIEQSTKQSAVEHVAKLGAYERQQAIQEVTDLYGRARLAITQGPEAWDAFKGQYGQQLQAEGVDLGAVSYEQGPEMLAGLKGYIGALNGDLGGAAEEPATVQALRIRAQEAGLQPGTPAYQEFMRTGGKVDASRIILGPDGQPLLVEGDAAANFKFTEGQSKDNVYSTRARGALDVLEPVADALASVGNRAANLDPTGLARGLQSEDFQVAEQAGTEFLQAILRKDTGAAITEGEVNSYGKVYLPQIGDGPAVLEAKRQARIRAVNALESGMTAQQMLVRDRALVKAAEEAGEDAQTKSEGPQPGVTEDGYRFLGGDPSKPENWQKVE